MKTLLLLLLIAAPAFAQDSTKTAQKDLAWDNFNAYGVPLDSDGDPIAPSDLKLIEDANTYMGGWKFDSNEWKMLKEGFGTLPEYYNSPVHGTNGGHSIG